MWLCATVLTMGRPAGIPQPKGLGPRAAATTAKRIRVVLYVTPEHHEQIHYQSLAAGMSIGRYVEGLLDNTGRSMAPAAEPKDALPIAM